MNARIVAQQWVSLDGFAAGPGGEGDLFASVPPEADRASMEHNQALAPQVSEVMLGRRSYEAFVKVWPTADLPVAQHVNTVPKIVFSRSLTAAPWGRFEPAQVQRDAIAYAGVRREGISLLWGSLEVMAQLLRAGLVDELDLFVAPVVLGAGTPLLPAGLHLNLDLLQVEAWSSVAHLRYAVSG